MCFVVCSDAGGINTKDYDLVDQDGLPTDATQGGWIVLAAERLPVRNRLFNIRLGCNLVIFSIT